MLAREVLLQRSWLSELERWPAIGPNAMPERSENMRKLRKIRTSLFAGPMRKSIIERRCGYVAGTV